MLTPSLEEYVQLIGEDKRSPVRRRIPADLETPVSAFLKLRACGATFLLESVEQGIQVGRYSFIGLAPYATIKLQDEKLEIRRNGASETLPVDPEHPFAPVRKELSRSRTLVGDLLPAPFAGAVGYIGYDMARYFDRMPDPRPSGLKLPDYYFLFPDAMAVFDHVKSEIEILTLPPDDEPAIAYAAADTKIQEILRALESPLNISDNGTPPDVKTPSQFNMSEESFKEKVGRIKEYILAGDTFQTVLSQRLRGETHVPPFQIYRALRILNPSPYMFFMNLGDFQIIGSSPEVLVKVENRKATLCPIAGTRPRGDTPAVDQELEEELLADEKERAEHVMLVDLGRNDLGRVCEIGSVVTDSLMHIEKYSHVMHIVSRVTGTLRADLDMFDLLRATFPAGTVTGAPKIRAMEIIGELEEEHRGPYAGAVGYFGHQGDMDMCITIRTLIMRGNQYFAQAGAGIVADSNPAFEHQETLNKIQALTKAISIAEEGF
jgi:anthranilate synthase component 1